MCICDIFLSILNKYLIDISYLNRMPIRKLNMLIGSIRKLNLATVDVFHSLKESNQL